MAISKEKFREVVFLSLFMKQGKGDEDSIPTVIMAEASVSKKTVREASVKVEAILTLADQLDSLIDSAAFGYAFDRIPLVEKSLMRLGCFEMLHDDAIPYKVAITEAVRLAKKFSTKEGSRFVNAVLDAIWRKENGEAIDSESLQETGQRFAESEAAAAEAAEDEANDQLPEGETP